MPIRNRDIFYGKKGISFYLTFLSQSFLFPFLSLILLVFLAPRFHRTFNPMPTIPRGSRKFLVTRAFSVTSRARVVSRE